MRHLFLILALFVLPMRVFAAERTHWNLGDALQPAVWEVGTGLEVGHDKNGIMAVALKQASLIRTTDPLQHFDTLTITYSSTTEAESSLLWHPASKPERHFVMLPIVFTPGEKIEMEIDLVSHVEWEGSTDMLGVVLPEGAQVTLHSIELQRWGILDNMTEGWKTFWTFDAFRPSSINFVWGPQLAGNPITRDQMFHELPPQSHSANTAFYILIGLMLIYTLTKKAPKTFWIGVLCLWVLYDIRMGSEYLSYLKTDYDNYISKELGARTFRERQFFDDFAEALAPVLAEDKEYVLVAPQRWPYFGVMRYHTFPSLPVNPAKEIDTWTIYRRPDITLSDAGELVIDGEAASKPGRIVHTFDTGTFLFRTDS